MRLISFLLIVLSSCESVSVTGIDKTKNPAEEFFVAYQQLWVQEEQFRPPDIRVQDSFYKYVLPYNVFMSQLTRPSEEPSAFWIARAALARYSDDKGRSKELLLTAINKFGIVESATLMSINDVLVSYEELDTLAEQDIKKSKFFIWSMETRQLRK